jgi:hypothetical protein
MKTERQALSHVNEARPEEEAEEVQDLLWAEEDLVPSFLREKLRCPK